MIPLKKPSFWAQKNNPIALLLSPFSVVYKLGYDLKEQLSRTYKSKLPVICVGNVTAGGAGKTTLVKWLLKNLPSNYSNPCVLMRGYGGQVKGPYCVSKEDSAVHVGDEAVMLRASVPVIISANRADGAKLAEELGFDLIIMDDGLQNPGLHKDFIILAVDGHYGLGNGQLLPAGPLRQPFKDAEKIADVVIVSEGANAKNIPADHPLRSHLKLGENSPAKDKKYVAFTGIANPKRFFLTLNENGYKVLKHIAFSDHHLYTTNEIDVLKSNAQALGCELITTEKDFVRLTDNQQRGLCYLPIEVEVENFPFHKIENL